MSSGEKIATVDTCPKCNADIRDGSVFCYNCGGRVTDEGEDQAPAESLAETAQQDDVKPVTKPAPGLRTARDIRRRERTFERKPKEITWEVAASGPDMQLLIITGAIALFTVVVVLLILYLS
jgi:uncharacterized Zn finger protein (UPF0148 family)